MHPFQHVIAADNLTEFRSSEASGRALAEAGVTVADVDIAGIYDSFSITLLVFIEETKLNKAMRL